MSLPTQYQNFIALSRYARWLPKEKRRESWEETVKRYIHFWAGRYSKEEIDYSIILECEEAIKHLEIMPSMRCLMTAGPALDRDNIAGFNPVSGDTRVVTKELGNVPIKLLADEVYTVLNKEGKWTRAYFKSYGEQSVSKVVVRLNSNTVKEVEATSNHRWVLQDGTVKPTHSLVEGDRIDFISAPKPAIDADYSDGVRHGLVYGDGTAVRAHKKVKGYNIRLCGNSAEQLEWFTNYTVCYPASANGDPIVMMYDDFAATHSLKDTPNPDIEGDSYLLGFIRGWLAADGCVTKSSQVSLCVNTIGRDWLLANAERLGFTIQRVYKQSSETNYGKRKGESFIVYFSRSSIVKEDFLCSWKRDSFRELKSHYVVKSVEPSRCTEVYCAEVPDTNTFVLEGGLLTGNCAFVAVDNPRVFDETMYVLCCGTGVGFSVERQYISQLPEVAEEFHETDTTIVVADSKIGWATSFRDLISLLYNGKIPKWDLSKIRPAGAPLKTFGGRASGPRPLDDLFRFSVEMFIKAAGRKLTSIECHDLMCKIAEIVVVGGVRRSALISLSNLTDERMRSAKSGQWWEDNPQRALANNSVCYTEKPDVGIFMKEWYALYESKSGERGIYNREAANKMRPERREAAEFGCNPCSEINLRSKQLCNLTEVVVRPSDTLEDLKRKVRLATILGTLQATLTDFRYLSTRWKKNTEEEALLGVSLTGIMDHPILSGQYVSGSWFDHPTSAGSLESVLETLKQVSIETNKEWAEKLGIMPAAATTCVKPSGTVSQLVDSASGIHTRHSPYYIRTVRSDKKDPLARLMVDVGFPVEDDITKPASTHVFSFPIEAPKDSVYRDDRTAIQQLELWKVYAIHWCEHKPSITVSVKEDEWFEVGAWVYKNFDICSGVSFLPHSNHSYKQAPYQELKSREEYLALLEKIPKDVDWSLLSQYEEEDNTIGQQTLACTGSSCEIVDLG